MSNNFYDLFTKPEAVRPAGASVTPLDPARASRYAAKALSSEVENVVSAAEGTRNDSLNKAAYSIGQLVAAGHVEHTDAWRALADAGAVAGLEDEEIRATLASGLGAGADTPRVVPDLPPVPEPTILAPARIAAAPAHEPDPQVEGEGEDVDDLAATWAPVDLTDVLEGTYTPELPSLMQRTDGAFLLYPGRIHSFHGESESGKSLVAQAEAANLIAGGSDVLFIDFESDHAAVVGRLMEFGATKPNIAAHFTYVRPEVDPRKFLHEREAVSVLLGRTYALAVIDGVTEALGIFGASTKDNDEITAFMRLLPRTVARLTGAAVVMVDHVTKDSESRGRFAIGGQAKMMALDGAAYVVEVTEALGRGRRGMVTLRVAKDRPGGVRAQAGPFRATDRTQEAARIVVDSTGGSIVVEVREPLTEEQVAAGFRPTHIMEKVSEFVEKSTEPLSTTAIEEAVDGRAETVRKALQLLISGHFLKAETGPRNSRLHTSLQPYREARDPASSSYVTTLKTTPSGTPSATPSHPVPPRPGRGDERPRPEPLRSRAPGDGVGVDETGVHRPDDRDGVDTPLEQAMDVACAKCFRPTPTTDVASNGRCPRCVAQDGETR